MLINANNLTSSTSSTENSVIICSPTSRQRLFHGPQAISGASQQNSIAAFSWTTEVDEDKMYF